jgi:hypothetical protein
MDGGHGDFLEIGKYTAGLYFRASPGIFCALAILVALNASIK